MGNTPDRFPGPLEDEELRLIADADPPSVDGAVKYDGSSFMLRDATGVFNPRTGGSGITAEEHKTIRQLIHFIDEGPAEGFADGLYKETLPAGSPFHESEIWWESAAKTKKIVELIISRNVNKTPSAETWKMYGSDGVTVISTITDTYSYSGVIETTRNRAIA